MSDRACIRCGNTTGHDLIGGACITCDFGTCDDCESLRARLAECERERDEFHAMLKSVVDYAADDMGMGIRAVIGADAPLRVVRSLRAERDAAIQRAATAEGKLRETTYAALAARGQAEADTVAGIADWLERLGYMSPEHVALVRAYAWRGKEGA